MASQLIKDIKLIALHFGSGDIKHPLISVPSETPVDQVSAILHDNNILAVPVYDKQKSSFIGFIDTLELLKLNSLEYANYLRVIFIHMISSNEHSYIRFFLYIRSPLDAGPQIWRVEPVIYFFVHEEFWGYWIQIHCRRSCAAIRESKVYSRIRLW